MSTNLIDSYVSEVGRRLSRRTRTDIEAEIRSTVQDMLEELSRQTGKPVDEEMTLEVLKAYGAPEKVAATYQGERYLIGPHLYPTFMLVLRIALSVIGVLAAIGLGIAVYQTSLTPTNAIETIFKAISNFIATGFSALGIIVIIFALLEWALFRADTSVDFKGLPKEKEWDPRSLARVSPANQIKMGQTIAEVVGVFAAIVIFNFYPQILGFGIFSNGNWYLGAGNAVSTPLLSQAFFHFVPYLTLVGMLTILLDIVLLRMGHWNTTARVILIGLKVISIIIAAVMLGGPSLLAITAQTLTPALGAEGARTLVTMLNLLIRIALWLGIFGSTVEIIRAIARFASSDIAPQFAGKS